MLNIYVGSYGAYNDGILDGGWISLPCDNPWDEIESHCVPGAEEFGIFDYECDFAKIDELDNIDDLNEAAEKMEGFDDYSIACLKALVSLGYGLLESFDLLNDCIFHADMNMSDIAYSYYEECYNLDDLGYLANYIDWEAVGRDMELEGCFVEVDSGIVEVII